MRKLKGVMINGEWLGEGFIINQQFRAICDISPQIMSEFIKVTKELGKKSFIEISSYEFVNKNTIKISFIKDKKEELSVNLTFEKANNSLKLVSRSLNNNQSFNNQGLVYKEIFKEEKTSSNIQEELIIPSQVQDCGVNVIDSYNIENEFTQEVENNIEFTQKNEEIQFSTFNDLVQDEVLVGNCETQHKVDLVDDSINVIDETNIDAFVENSSSVMKEDAPAVTVAKTVTNTAEIQPTNMNPIHIMVELQQPQVQQSQVQYIPQPQFIQQPMPIIMPQQAPIVQHVDQSDEEKILTKSDKEKKKVVVEKDEKNADILKKTEADDKIQNILEDVDLSSDKILEEKSVDNNIDEKQNQEQKQTLEEKQVVESISVLESDSLKTDSESEEIVDFVKSEEVDAQELFLDEIDIEKKKEASISDEFDFESLDLVNDEKEEDSSITNLEEELLSLKKEIEEEKLEAQIEEICDSSASITQEELEQYKEELAEGLPVSASKPEDFMIQALLTEMMSLKEEISVLKAEAVKKITVEEFFGDKEKSVVRAEDADFKILGSNEKHNAAILDEDVFFAGEKLYKWGETLYLKD